MARQTRTPPEAVVTPEQALVTPATRPEVLLALQQQQSNQAISNECGLIRQELGILQGELSGLKTAQSADAETIRKIDKFHTFVIAVIISISVLIGGLWFFVGSKITTLMQMADERQYLDAHPEQKKAEALPTPSSKAGT